MCSIPTTVRQNGSEVMSVVSTFITSYNVYYFNFSTDGYKREIKEERSKRELAERKLIEMKGRIRFIYFAYYMRIFIQWMRRRMVRSHVSPSVRKRTKS